MRTLTAILGVAILLSGCGIARRHQEIEQAQQGLVAAKAECQAQKFPTHVEKAQCLGDAERQYHLPFASQPDLILRKIALRNALAVKVDAHQMTLADAELELANEDSRAATERLARSNAQRSVAAHERSAAAAAASAPPSFCMKNGNFVNCF